MADSATVAAEKQVRSADSGQAAPATDDPRGALTIDNRVGEKLAARAALDISGVERYSSGLGLLGNTVRSGHGVGSDYPRARVDMSVSAPTVALTIVVVWPAPVVSVCREVRRHVADELARLTGMRPSKVDVTVTQVVSRAAVSETRSGFVELDASTAGDDATSDEAMSPDGASPGGASPGGSNADGASGGRSNDQNTDNDKADDS